MKNSRKVLSILFAFLLVFTSFSSSHAKAFKDTRNHWAKVYIDNLSSRGILVGYEDNTFRPNARMKKAEFYSMINSLAGQKKTYAVTFTDVSPSHWFYNDVAKAIKAGYLIPTTGQLHPNNPITREDAFRIIGYMYGLEERPSATTKFSDHGSISASAKGYIGRLVELNIVEGKGNGTFSPKAPVTRAEVSKLISMLLERYGQPREKVIIDSKIKFGSRNMYN